MMRIAAFLFALTLVLAAGCGRTHERFAGDGGPAARVTCDGLSVDLATDSAHCGACGNACADGDECRSGSCCAPTFVTPEKLDMLFVIDNSGSMTEEQASFAEELPRMMTALMTGDLNGDGLEDMPPVRSLHLGVVTTDMGTGGFTVPTCREPHFGDDGVLRRAGNTALPGCMATYPSFLEWRPDSGMVAPELARDLQCVAQMGSGGCGFEQQLEAALKAVTPSTAPTVFNMGTRGHADRANAGFLRPDSVLAIVILTDEEDCSAADPELFNPTSAVYTGNLNLRCFSYPMAVHPIERYAEGFLATRQSPRDLVYAVIAGVPPDLVADGASYDTILADSRMQEIVDPTDSNRLTPSCNVPGRGLAFPPRRMVGVARQLEGAGAFPTVQSICQSDSAPAFEGILATIAQAREPRASCR